jgi:hypothetical protein
MHPCPTLTVLAAGQVAELPRSLSGSASVLGFTSLPRVFANASGRIEFIIFLIMESKFTVGERTGIDGRSLTPVQITCTKEVR